MTDPIIASMQQDQGIPGSQMDSTADDPIIAQMKQEQAAQSSSRAALAIGYASAGSADRAAQNISLAKQFKVPSDVVDKWPDQFRQYAITDTAKTALASAPTIADAIAKNPDLAKILHDELPVAGAVEQSMSEWNPSLGQRFTQWMRSVTGRTALDRASAMNEVAAKESGKTMGEVREDFNGMSEVPMQAAAGLLHSGTFGILPNMAGDAQTTMGKVGEGAGETLGFMYGGPVKAAEWLLGKVGIKGLTAVAENEGRLASAAKIIAGEVATVGTASALGATGSAIDSESVGEGLGKVGEAGMQGMATGVVFGGGKSLLPKDTIAHFLGRAAAYNVGNDLANGTDPFDNRSLEQKVFDYGLNTLFAKDGVHPEVREQARADFAVQDAQWFQKTADLVSQLKMRERAPDEFKQMVKDMADTHEAPDLYVDAKVFAQVLDQAGVKGEELIKTMPEVAAQMREGLQTEGIVKIPLEDYASHIVGSTVDEALRGELRIGDPQAATYNEGVKYYQEQAAKMKAAADEANKGREDDALFKASGQKVEDHVREQLGQTGRFPAEVNKAYASMWRAFFESTSAKDEKGRLPHDLMQEYGMQVRGEHLPGASYHQPSDGVSVEGYHYSKAERTHLTTGLFGTGLQGSARDEIMNHPDKRLRQRLSFYVDKGTGINPEAGVGGIAHRAKLTNLYDANTDPLRLREGSARDFESRVLDHGYSGYLDRLDGTQSAHAILLGDHTIEPEILGPQTKLKGEVVGAAGQRAAAGRDVTVDALQNRRDLPTGSPSRSRWAEILEKQAPKEYEAMKAAGVFEGRDEPLYKDELIREFKNKTEAPDYAKLSTQQESAGHILEQAARRESDVGHKRNSDGRYVGAPDWVGKSPQQLAKLRRNLDQLAKEGLVGKHWYEKSARAVLDLTGGNKEDAEKFIGLLAIYSPGTGVAPNTTAALKAWYQWKAGQPIVAGRFPTAMGKKADAWLNKGEDWGGIKTNNFYTDLMEEIDPSKVDTHHSTMDMWMALAGDYGSKVLDQGPKYQFMQREIKRIADQMGWRPHQVQAAIWTSIRARVMGSENERNAWEDKQGIRVPGEKGGNEIAKGREYDHFRAATDFGMKWKPTDEQGNDITQQKINESDYDFGTALRERSAQVSWEATPGASTGVLPGIHDAPMHQQVEYLVAIRKALSDENGRDLIDKKLGLMTSNGTEGYSGWQGKPSVGVQQRAGVTVEGGRVTDQSRARVNLAADIRGLVTNQEGVAWHFPSYSGAKYGQNGVEFKLGRQLTHEETAALYDTLTQELGHSYAPPIPTLEGFRVLNFPDAKFALEGETDKAKIKDLQGQSRDANDAFHDAVRRAVESQGFAEEVKDVARFETDGELRENDWSKGDADYRQRIQAASLEGSGSEGPDLLKWVDNELRPRVDAVNRDFAERYGWDQPGRSGTTLNQGEAAPRGQIAFGKDITQQPSIISLLKNADLSTFLHESGHFFLEVTSDMAGNAGADSVIGKDFQKLLDWFGVKDADTWRSMSPAEKTQFHEQFARGFEAYLMEGKAPTTQLQGIFGRFRSWLVSLYKDPAALNVQLTPEVKGVMDRMLGSEEAIAQAEQVRGMLPLFTEKPDGMTDEAWAAYQGEHQSATEEAIAALQGRSIKDMQWISNLKGKAERALRVEAREARNKIKEEVTKQVNEMPAFAAKDFMTEHKDADPEMVAEKFGFNSAEEMAQAISDHGNKKDAIEGMTDQRMLQEHGELTDPQSIERAAEAAIHNAVRTRVLARELNALAKATGSPRLLAKAAAEAAEAAIAAKKVGEIKPRQYQVAEGKAGKAAMDALKKGDTQTAAIQKRAQLLNNALAREAAKAQEMTQKILAYMKRFERINTLKNIAPEERDQILKLLANYDFRKNPSDEPTRAQKNLQQWLESQQQAGYTPVVDAAALKAQPRTQYRDMPYEALTGLYDTVRSIEFIGKAKNQADWQGNKISLDELIKNVFIPKMKERGDNFTSDELHNREENRSVSHGRLVLDKMASFMRASMAELKPQYFKSNHYDAHEILGPFHELFDQVFNANYRKVDMTRAQSQKARALAEQLGKDWQKSIFDKVANGELIDLKASEEQGKFVPLSITRDNLIQMVAHAGNESNFDKLVKGYGWQPDQFWKFLDGKLSAKDVEAVKAQWEMANAHWPETKAMYERMGQVVPPKVEGRAFRLKLDDGSTVELPGGYMPIRYDPLRSRLGEKKQAERAISADGDRFGYDFFGRDTTTNGSMNARVDGYTDAIDLSHNAFERAMAETIHDLAYRETLVNTNKIITHPEFRKQFYRTYGREDYDALHTWLGRIANSENMDTQVGNMGRVMRYTRTGMVMNAIALRVSTVLKHGGSAFIKTTGYFVGGGEKYYLARQAAMATDYKAQMAEAVEKFPEIRARALQQDRDYRETISSLYTGDSLQARAERFGHAAVAWADLLTAVATAHGAYDRAITEGIPVNMGGTGDPMTHAQAVSYANQIVREAHGSQIESMRSNIMTNPHEGVKMFTTLYGFMNNTLGQTSDTVSKLRTAGINKPEVMARALMALIVPALWAGILTDGVPTKDDWKSWLGKALGSETLGMVPFARDAYSFLEGYKHAGVIGVESWMQTILQPVIDATKAVEGKKVSGAISHAADAIGMGLHIPGLGQLGKTAQYLWDVHTGKQNPQSALEEAQGLTVGIHKPKP